MFYFFGFRPTGVGYIGGFAAMTIAAGHLITIDDPMMSSAGAFKALPSIRCNEFFVFGCFHLALRHRDLLNVRESKSARFILKIPRFKPGWEKHESSYRRAHRSGSQR
jgi:hypothetical protein